MAARKSCTHLTWAEAKAKVGHGNGVDKKKVVPKSLNHGKHLAEKIITKQQPNEKDKIADRQAAKRARKDEERAKKIEEKRRSEKEHQRLEAVVKPHEQSQERMLALSKKIQQEKVEIDGTNYDAETLTIIVECRRSQLDEIMALEAMLTTDEFLIAEKCELDKLRNMMEELDESDETSLRAIARHPQISFTLQLTIEDESRSDVIAHVLMNVAFPKPYPSDDVKPQFKVAYCMVTDKTMVCNANKPLESLGFLDEANLIDSIASEVETLLPYPCVYEIMSTWLPENLFSKFITMKSV